MAIRKDLLVTEEIAESSGPQGDPLSSRVSDCLATPLALASSWKSEGAARRIVKDKGSGLIKPIETHRIRSDQCKEFMHALVSRTHRITSANGFIRTISFTSATVAPYDTTS